MESIDFFIIQSYRNVNSFSLNINYNYQLQFSDITGTAISSDNLPNSVDLASWGNKNLIIGNSDSSFYIVGTMSEVPVPAAVWLLGSGLIGLIGIKRKIKKV